MSYVDIIKHYEPLVAKKLFSYDDAIKYWTALNEPYNLHYAAHSECSKYNDEKQPICKTRSKMLDLIVENKKKATHFFNKTINNSALFKDMDKFLKNDYIKKTKLYIELHAKMLLGGYYEKYMKYNAKYLALKRDIYVAKQ